MHKPLEAEKARPSSNLPRPGPKEWQMQEQANPGDMMVHVDVQDGVAIGDILELSPGQPEAEDVTISKFSSVHPSSSAAIPACGWDSGAHSH